MRIAFSRVALVAVILVVGAATARAQTRSDARPDDIETPRGMALGSGVRASAAGTSAVDYNPANLPVARLYHIEEFTGYEPSSGRLIAGSALADSTTDYMHAGLAVRGIHDMSGRSSSGFDGRVALAFPLGPMFAVGVAGRYASITRSAGAPGAAGVNTLLFEGFTLDVAARVTPLPGLHIAAIGTNLIDTGSRLAPRLVGGSASYTIGNVFTFGADLFFDASNSWFPTGHVYDAGEHFMAGAGLELLVASRFAARAGYFYDKARDVHAVSGGIGWVDSKFGVDLAFRQEVASTHRGSAPDVAELQTTLLLSFRYFVQ